jgi:hypothetical protein
MAAAQNTVSTAETDTPLPVPAPAVPVPAPTLDDYRAEWGTYVAAHDLPVGAAIAVTAGGPVPASHPMLTEWLAQGMVVKRAS